MPLDLQCELYQFNQESLPAISASASRDTNGTVNLTLSNLDPHQSKEISVTLRGTQGKQVTARILTAPEIGSYNTFDEPTVVQPSAFNDLKLVGDKLSMTAPAKSVIALEIR